MDGGCLYQRKNKERKNTTREAHPSTKLLFRGYQTRWGLERPSKIAWRNENLKPYCLRFLIITVAACTPRKGEKQQQTNKTTRSYRDPAKQHKDIIIYWFACATY